jgi:hypothetical protein
MVRGAHKTRLNTQEKTPRFGIQVGGKDSDIYFYIREALGSLQEPI